MRFSFRPLAVGCIAALAMLGSACDKAAPSPVNVPETFVIETFSGTLQPSGEAFYSFAMSTAGNVSLTLLSVTGPSVPADALFPLGIGQPVGTGCTASVDVAVQPGGSPQHTTAKGSGVYCVRIADNALLGAAATFALNIRHPR